MLSWSCGARTRARPWHVRGALFHSVSLTPSLGFATMMNAQSDELIADVVTFLAHLNASR